MSNKLKPHKGLQKRVKITGRGKVKYNRPGKRHLNGHMSGEDLRRLRSRPGIAHQHDAKRMERMLHHRVQGTHQ